MSLNVHPRGGKGRRKCPALGGWIEARTCGQHRLRDVRCPPNCGHLKRHQRYEHKRAAPAFNERWLDGIVPLTQLKQREPLDLILAFMHNLYGFLAENPSTKDGDLLDGLRFVRRQLSPIQVVGSVGNSLGKHALNGLRSLQEQRPQFDLEKQALVVDCLLDIVALDEQEERLMVNGLMGFLERHFTTDLLKGPPADDAIIVPPHIITPD